MGGPGSGPHSGGARKIIRRSTEAQSVASKPHGSDVQVKSVAPQHPSTISHGSTKSQHDHTISNDHRAATIAPRPGEQKDGHGFGGGSMNSSALPRTTIGKAGYNVAMRWRKGPLVKGHFKK